MMIPMIEASLSSVTTEVVKEQWEWFWRERWYSWLRKRRDFLVHEFVHDLGMDNVRKHCKTVHSFFGARRPF
jgi:hypothetical protein